MGSTPLTPEKYDLIKIAIASGETAATIAKAHHVRKTCVYDIRRGRTKRPVRVLKRNRRKRKSERYTSTYLGSPKCNIGEHREWVKEALESLNNAELSEIVPNYVTHTDSYDDGDECNAALKVRIEKWYELAKDARLKAGYHD